MRIDGNRLAEPILEKIKGEAKELRQKGITPKLVIITIGREDVWETYVRRKLWVGRDLRIETLQIHIDNPSQKKVLEEINKQNNDSTVHGIIVQRPLPKDFSPEIINEAVTAEKDVDGFCHNSMYKAPVYLGVRQIISQVLNLTSDEEIKTGLSNQSIVVIGKGQTGGRPVIIGLKNLGLKPSVIDTKTPNKEELIKNADIVISAVGKENIINERMLKKNAIVIGVGIHKREGKLRGDYEHESIKNITSYHTPTPGGVGPLTIAYLFENVIKAAKNTPKY